MNTREWALLTFTILGQMAAGSLFVLMIVRAYATAKAGLKAADRMTDGPLFMVVPMMGLALLASLLHLNNLSNVVKAIPNLGSSWLSREVVISVVFVVMAIIYTFLQWRRIGSNELRTVVGWITAIIGLVQTYAMALVYMIRTQPSWNTSATVITFFVTSLLLGSTAVAVALVTNYLWLQRRDVTAAETQVVPLRGALKGTALTAIVLLGIEFMVLPIYMAYLSTQGSAALASLRAMTGPYGVTLGVRLLLVFVGAGILAAYLFQTASTAGKERAMAAIAYGAFLFVLVGEIMGRFLFYATHVRIGL